MRVTILTLAALGLVAGLAQADDACPTNEPTATIETPHGTYYLVNDACQPDDCIFSTWVYQESNGIPGLQRCDNFGEACADCDGDTIIF